MDRYDAHSITRTGEFLVRCIDRVKEPNIFWAAIQPNSLADNANASNIEITKGVNRLKKMLLKKKVHLGMLSSNLRNSKEISTLNVKAAFVESFFGGTHDMKKEVKSEPATMVGPIPTLIPLSGWEFKKVIGQVLDYVVKEFDSKFNQPSIVFLHDDYFTTKEIRIALQKRNKLSRKITKKKILTYPSSEDQDTSTENLMDFLQNDDNILITHEKYFRGCESSNIVYFSMSDENVRSSIARAVENLYVIQKLVDPFKRFGTDYKFEGFITCHPYSLQNPIYRFFKGVQKVCDLDV